MFICWEENFLSQFSDFNLLLTVTFVCRKNNISKLVLKSIAAHLNYLLLKRAQNIVLFYFIFCYTVSFEASFSQFFGHYQVNLSSSSFLFDKSTQLYNLLTLC